MSDVITHEPHQLRAAPPPKRRRWVRVLLASVCALLAVMWVYAFFFAPKEGVYFVTDSTWRTSANQICDDATQQRLALADTGGGFITNPTHEQMLQRADIVDKSTDILARMIDRIEALPLAGEKNQIRADVFIKYYRVIVDDRRRYTAGLRAFSLEPYRETPVSDGPVSNVIIDFITGNAIPKCMPPTELSADR